MMMLMLMMIIIIIIGVIATMIRASDVKLCVMLRYVSSLPWPF